MSARKFTPTDDASSEGDFDGGSMKIVIPNFSDVRASMTFPDGESFARVKTAKAGVSKKQEPQIMVIWELVEDPKRTIIDYLNFGAAQFGPFTMPKLIGMGFDEAFDGGDFEVSDLVGIEAYLTVGMSKANGQYQARQQVKKISQAPTSASLDDLIEE